MAVSQGRRQFGTGNSTGGVSIIIPVFNERESIEQLIERTLAMEIPFTTKQTIVVEDGSTDGTREWLEQRFPDGIAAAAGVQLIKQPRNLGKGASIRTALDYVTGDATVIMDADLELDPADIPRLVMPILTGQVDVVFGNRFTGGRRSARNMVHFLTNRSLTLLVRLLTRLDLNDVEVGYKAFRTDLLRRMRLQSAGFEIEVELAVKLAKLPCRFGEVPVSYAGRADPSKKKFRWLDGMSAVLWVVYFRWQD